MKLKLFLFTSLILALGSFFACQKEAIYTATDAKVKFSKDTLRFDTVFTSVGSATRLVKIINPYDKTLIISKIYLEKGEKSLFNLNIDGVSGDSQENIEIPAKDSIYVFAEVTINPNDQNNPFILNENIVLETNGTKQNLVLEAWGQNANYIPSNSAKGKVAAITTDQTWNDPKPYIIYGILVIDNAKLTIAAGTKVYIHGGLIKGVTDKNKKFVYNDGMIIVQNGGSIETKGTKDKPVLIGGDRLEKEFAEVPAQWNLMYLGANCTGQFNYTTIKNARLGVFVDSLAKANFYYSRVYNTAGPAIYARQSEIKMDNCLLYNTGSTSFAAEQGGKYDLTYCTLANYGQNSSSLLLSNSYCKVSDQAGKCVQRINEDLYATVKNSIIAGSQKDVIDLIQSDQAVFNYAFDHSIVKVEKLIEPKSYPDFLTKNCTNCINLKVGDRLFKSIDKDIYKLDTLSVAEMKAKPLSGFSFDLEGVPRDPQKPDIGAYEYKPK
jgi:hypothetical protein